MRIVITGGLGQLGRALQAVLAEHELTIADLPETDITDRRAIESVLQETRAELVIHCAALTDVDGCAREPVLAYQINGLGTQNVALACREINAEMIHISTNEIFAGDKPGGYEEWELPSPINAYGRSKAAAEAYVRAALHRYYIVRTAWLYAPGGSNFIHAILDRAKTSGELRVVADEIGNPTYVNDLADSIALLLVTGQYGTYHFTNTGACSRWAFANEILKQAGVEDVTNTPILAREYDRASDPPRFGALRNIAGAALGITLPPWEQALANYMAMQALAK